MLDLFDAAGISVSYLYLLSSPTIRRRTVFAAISISHSSQRASFAVIERRPQSPVRADNSETMAAIYV